MINLDKINFSIMREQSIPSQSTITCSKSITEKLKQDVKYVQS